MDGLRGLAALVVVACHALSTLPGIGSVVFDDRTAGLGPLESWAVFSPLHVLWNGTPAVHVFFVLSGFVLILPFTKPGAARSWAPYYAKRLLRLYLPAWAALAAAVALIAVVPRTPSPLQSPWADMYVTSPNPGQIARDALLVMSSSTINTPLWTLKWEVLFSLLLPLYVVIALRWRRLWLLKLGLTLALVGVGAVQDIDWLIYLPIFAIGAILGAERERIRSLTSSWPGLVWLPVTAAGLVLANAEWLGRPNPVQGVEALVTVGATLIVLVFLLSGTAKKLGDTAVAQWLGRVSFSVYLVHLPIILAGVTLLRSVSLPLALAVSVVASFIVGELFFRYVEGPAQRLSVAAGRAVERRMRRPARTESAGAPAVVREQQRTTAAPAVREAGAPTSDGAAVDSRQPAA